MSRALVAGAAIAVLGASLPLGVKALRHSERRIAGFGVEDSPATRWSGPITVIAPATYGWPVSVCTLRHDGRTVASASFDAWYE